MTESRTGIDPGIPADPDPWPCPHCGQGWPRAEEAIVCCWDEEDDR